MGSYEDLSLPESERKVKYSQTWLADDYENANGDNVLNYTQAYDKVKDWGQRTAKQARLEKLGIEMKDVSGYTIADAMNDWLKGKETTGNRAKGLNNYRYSINRWIVNSEIGATPVVELTTRSIERWFEWFCRQPRSGCGQQNGKPPQTDEEKRARRSTAKRVLRGLLIPALNYAVKKNESLAQECSPYQWERIEINFETDATRETVVEPQDRAKLLDAARPDFRMLLTAAFLTGLRHSELRLARVRDFRNGVLFVPKANTKGNKDFTVHLGEAGVDFFDRLVKGKQPDDFILVKENGTPWMEHSQTKIMERLCKKAGIGKINFHDLRRTRISELSEKGLDIELSRRNIGHSTPGVLEKHYLKVRNNRFAAEIEKSVGEDDWELVNSVCPPRRPNKRK